MAPHLDSTATHPGKKHAGETRSDKQSPRIFIAKRCVFPFGMQVQPLNLLNTVNIKKHSSEEWAVLNLSGISIIIVTGFKSLKNWESGNTITARGVKAPIIQ